MKRVLVASILGLAASVASSYGQANFYFDTYSAANGAIVTWNDTLLAVGDGEGFHANLLWQYGTTTGDAGLANTVGTTFGYIIGPSFSTAANYIPSTPIDFTIQVWQGASYAVASGGNTLAFGSLTWTEPGIGAGNPPELFAGLSGAPILVDVVPEPSTLALLGLGAAAMTIFRRRQ